MPDGDPKILPQGVTMKAQVEAGLMTAFIVLLVVAFYNSVAKPYTPTPIRNLIGLG